MSDLDVPTLGISRQARGVAAILGVALLLIGCSRGADRGRTEGNVLRIPIAVSLSSIDPALASEPYSIDVTLNTFQGLVAMGPDNRVHPCLAESWDLSPDGKTYTFHLRQHVQFHDGHIFGAADVERSIERACSPQLDAPLASDFLGDVAGMPAFHAGNANSIAGIQVVDTQTVTITLDAPRPYFLAKLSCPVATIVDCRVIRDGVHIRSVSEMAGTGPFRFESYAEGQKLVQRAFNSYWGGRPKIDAIERPVMPDESSRINAFKRGEVDVVPQIDRADYAGLLADPEVKDEVRLFDRATLVYLALNTSAWPDRRVRQAIAMAIDREEIAGDTLSDTVISARGFLPPSVPGYRANPAWLAPDPATARKLMVESGHKDGQGLPALKISFAMENPDMERIADRIGAQVHDELGIDVQLDKMDSATLLAKQNGKQLQAVVSGWFADYIDPEDFLSLLLASRSSENHWNYDNPAYDRLCGEADRCSDPALRLRLYAKAEDLALGDAAMIPICYWKVPALIGPRIHGIRSYAGNYLPYSSVTLAGQ